MLRAFSKGTLKYLLERYPNLDEESANRILTRSRITREYNDMSVFGASFLTKNMNYEMHVTPADADAYFFGEESVSLVAGEEGIIYTETQ